MEGRRAGQGGGNKRPKRSWATLGCPKAKLQPNIFKWRLQHRQNYATNLWEDINFAMFVLATQPNTHTHSHTHSACLCSSCKKKNKPKYLKLTKNQWHPTPSLPPPPSLPLLELGFGFEFGLGWVGFWLPRDECHVVKFVQCKRLPHNGGVRSGRACHQTRLFRTKKLKNACNCFEGCPPSCLAAFLPACLPWNFLCILTCETAKFFHLTAQRPLQADSIDSHVNYILTHTHTWTPIYKLRVRWPGQSGTCTLSQWHNLCAQYKFRCIGWCIKWGRVSGEK